MFQVKLNHRRLGHAAQSQCRLFQMNERCACSSYVICSYKDEEHGNKETKDKEKAELIVGFSRDIVEHSVLSFWFRFCSGLLEICIESSSLL